MASLSKEAIRVASASTKAVKLRVRQSPIHVPVELRNIAANIVRAEQHFERTSSTDKAGESRHRSAARKEAGANLPLRQDRPLTADETHIAGEREFAPHPGGAAADRGDRYHRSAANTHEHIRQRLQTREAGRDIGRFLELREEIVVDAVIAIPLSRNVTAP
jgi:hypothetical protein